MWDLVFSILRLVLLLLGIAVTGSIIHYLSKWFAGWRKHLEGHINNQVEINRNLQQSIEAVNHSTDTILKFVEASKKESRNLRQLAFEQQDWMRKAEAAHEVQVQRLESHSSKLKEHHDKITDHDKRIFKLERKNHGAAID